MKRIDARERRRRELFLLEAASLPTAAGHEEAVVRFVEAWASGRRSLEVSRDRCGNLLVSRADFAASCRRKAPLFITAHLDHPAFVVLSAKGRIVELEFRGGVHDAYFRGAEIEIFEKGLACSFPARITALAAKAKPFKTVKARLERPAPVETGCIGRWKSSRPGIRRGLIHAPACDDVASVAAALLAYEDISGDRELGHAALLFTRAEEVGFVGAIGAARGGAIPKDARLVCLECSRSFPHDSPVGAGPIVRVGDRMSVFTPELTNLVSDIAEEHAKKVPAFKFQRKLMPGGVCEATAFASYGFNSSCLCLPLGNYHNMEDIEGALEGGRARVGLEFVSASDLHGLVKLLGVIARRLDERRPSARQAMEKRWSERSFVLKG